jgi:hypothetical protein
MRQGEQSEHDEKAFGNAQLASLFRDTVLKIYLVANDLSTPQFVG